MSDWNWVTTSGTIGELPVRILTEKRAETLLDAISGVHIADYRNRTNHLLSPGDVCILTAEITSVATDTDPTLIKIAVHDVEFLQRSGRSDSEVTSMMQHLDNARERRQSSNSNDNCENCRVIDVKTRLSAETKTGGRDLHYCAACGRLLSADEYDRWVDIHRK